MTAAAYILWCGVVWVLRGGKFGAIVRPVFGEPGTTVTRIVCAGLMAGPLAFVVGWWALALWASIYVAMTLGYFDESMGLEQPGRDHLWLAAWGVCVAGCAIMPALVFAAPHVWAWAALGALAVAAYASQKPLGRRWGLDWTERAEFLTGCAIGAALYGASLA
ncbi:MAG: hypothetical protein ING29_13045 [Azospirillum sp.]|nr:hypothetical protein [Azospirillum sp.]